MIHLHKWKYVRSYFGKRMKKIIIIGLIFTFTGCGYNIYRKKDINYIEASYYLLGKTKGYASCMRIVDKYEPCKKKDINIDELLLKLKSKR